MASAQPATKTFPPVTLAQRSAAALVILIVAALVAAMFWAADVIPLLASLESLSRQQQIGRARVLVSGYYVTQDFVSFGGQSLPPYVFAVGGRKDAPGVHVSPTLADLRSGKVAAVIDTATGDGSAAMPYQIQTLASWGSFLRTVTIGLLIALALAFWLAGPAVALLRLRG